ncbi:GntR family transcriptional regulator [Yinghuangia soli]|uniref:GntR family transcriptional regulator n=1 Tax=Yinghuangia soli TaxID=2908204 RepID=A0AA41U3R6_9ACTN|nr:GntR family transcriptional regulator [Yinghuangia soli]MCF2533008.1 GntR family transcriptional regulator [Yinghuangia soli]
MPAQPLPGDRPAYLEIADQLRVRIVSGELAAGAQLPSETDLRSLYGSSRETVRKALAILKTEGLVVSQHGRGVFVRRRTQVNRSTSARYVRAAWRAGTSAGQADLGDAGPKLRVDMSQVATTAASETVAKHLGMATGEPVVTRSRRYLQGDQPLQLASSFLPGDIAVGTRAEELDSGPGGSWARLEEAGWSFTHVREQVESRLPTFEESQLLHMSPGSPLFVIHRIATGTQADKTRILDYSELRLPAELYVLTYDSAIN